MNSGDNSENPKLHDFDDAGEAQAPVGVTGPKRPLRELQIDAVFADRYEIPVAAINAADHYDTRSTLLRPYALRMYMDHFPIRFIARKIDVNERTIRRWAESEGWEAKRNEVNAKFMNAIINTRVQQFAALTGDALDVISKTVRRYKEKPKEELKITDAEAISRIFVNLDRILRLSTGQATEITEQRKSGALKLPKNREELIALIQSDPFIDTRKLPAPAKDDDDAQE